MAAKSLDVGLRVKRRDVDYSVRPVCCRAFATAGPITFSVSFAKSRSLSSYKYGSNTHGNFLKKSNIPGSVCESIRTS